MCTPNFLLLTSGPTHPAFWGWHYRTGVMSTGVRGSRLALQSNRFHSTCALGSSTDSLAVTHPRSPGPQPLAQLCCPVCVAAASDWRNGSTVSLPGAEAVFRLGGAASSQLWLSRVTGKQRLSKLCFLKDRGPIVRGLEGLPSTSLKTRDHRCGQSLPLF